MSLIPCDLVLCNFQLPLRIKKKAICTPKMAAAVDSEAAKFSMLWFSLRKAEPAPVVLVCVAALAVLDIVSRVEVEWPRSRRLWIRESVPPVSRCGRPWTNFKGRSSRYYVRMQGGAEVAVKSLRMQKESELEKHRGRYWRAIWIHR